MRSPRRSPPLGRRLWASMLGVGLALGAGGARAAGPQDAESMSRQLFKRGEALAAESSFREACPFFQAAHDLNATGGTALRTADCYEKLGAPEQALRMYRYVVDHAASERVAERIDLAKARVAALEKQLRIEAPPPPAADPCPPQPAPPSRIPAAIAFSVGGAGLVVGGVAGALALSQASAVKQAAATECPTGKCASPALVAAQRGANTTAWIANVGLGVAVAGAVAGTVLLLTGKPARPSAGARVVRAIAEGGLVVRF